MERNFYGITDLASRQILAANLTALMERSERYHSTPAVERRTEELGLKVGKSTVDRLKRAEAPFNLDQLDVLAAVFGLDGWQLLVPWSDPKQPPILRSSTEDSLFRAMHSIASQVATLVKPGQQG